jgi:hypothetical protein
MARPILHLVAALASGLTALVGSVPASAQLRAVALSGQVAPDTGGGTYASFGSLDAARLSEVAFTAPLEEAPGRSPGWVGDVVPGNPYPYPVTFADFRRAHRGRAG